MTTVSFSGDEGTTGEDVLTYIEAHQDVEHVHCERLLSDEHIKSLEKLLRKYHSFIHLKSLSIPQNDISAAVGGSLSFILQSQIETLQQLDVSYNPLGSSGVQQLIEPLLDRSSTRHHRCAIKFLNLTHTQIGSKGASTLATLLRLNSSVSELQIGHNSLGTRGIKVIATSIAESPTIKVLDISYNQLGSRGTSILAKAFAQTNSGNAPISSLCELNLSHNKLGISGARTLCDWLVLDRKLLHLNVRGNAIGAEGASSFASALRHNYTLKSLNIGDNQIGYIGAELISEALTNHGTGSTTSLESIQSSNITLERLCLDWNNIGVEGAVAVSNMLRQNVILSYLDITGNNIGSDGAVSIAESIPYNISLSSLVLTSNQIGDAGAFALAVVLGRTTCRVESVELLDENPAISDEGAASLKRIPEIKRSCLLWLDGMLQDISRGNVCQLDLLFRSQQILRTVGNEELHILSQGLGDHCPQIRGFFLEGQRISSRGIESFASLAMSHGSNIVRIYIRRTRCGDDGASAIGEAMKHNTKLEVLSIMESEITPEGATSIAEGLSQHATIRRLNLDSNPIGDDGFKAIVKALVHEGSPITAISACKSGITNSSMDMKALLQIPELQLRGNKISDNGVLSLCQNAQEPMRLYLLDMAGNPKLSNHVHSLLRSSLPSGAIIDCECGTAQRPFMC